LKKKEKKKDRKRKKLKKKIYKQIQTEKKKVKMGWGVVESDVNKFPPGTVNLMKKPDNGELPQILDYCRKSPNTQIYSE
jgi:hypothetical protein